MQLATTLWSKSATFHVQLGVLSCTVNRACVSASLGRSVHVVVSLHKSTTDTYLWGRPDSGCLTRVRYRHLTRPSSSCEGRLRQTSAVILLHVDGCGRYAVTHDLNFNICIGGASFLHYNIISSSPVPSSSKKIQEHISLVIFKPLSRP